MARKRGSTGVTKKHLARAERESIQRRWILIGTAIVAVSVLGLVIYAWASVNLTAVASVNDEKISTSSFRGRVHLADAEIINQLASQGQTEAIPEQLQNREIIGQSVLDQMIDEVLIRQEAQLRGLSVTEEEVDKAIAEAFGFFPDGTPTPNPTSTPDITATALASITPTITEGPSPTPSPSFTPDPSPSPSPTSTPESSPTAALTSTPRPTPTVYTHEAFTENYAATLERLNDLYRISEDAFRSQFKAQLFTQKLYEEFEVEVPWEQEQVKAQHILVEDEATAMLVLSLLESGSSWDTLASEFSTDESNKDRGGDLGWFPRGRMIPEFEEAAFGGEIGEVVGPVETSFGWHIINILDKEIRGIDEYSHLLALQEYMDTWLVQARELAVIVIAKNWVDRIPPMPNLANIFPAQ